MGFLEMSAIANQPAVPQLLDGEQANAAAPTSTWHVDEPSFQRADGGVTELVFGLAFLGAAGLAYSHALVQIHNGQDAGAAFAQAKRNAHDNIDKLTHTIALVGEKVYDSVQQKLAKVPSNVMVSPLPLDMPQIHIDHIFGFLGGKRPSELAVEGAKEIADSAEGVVAGDAASEEAARKGAKKIAKAASGASGAELARVAGALAGAQQALGAAAGKTTAPEPIAKGSVKVTVKGKPAVEVTFEVNKAPPTPEAVIEKGASLLDRLLRR